MVHIHSQWGQSRGTYVQLNATGYSSYSHWTYKKFDNGKGPHY